MDYEIIFPVVKLWRIQLAFLLYSRKKRKLFSTKALINVNSGREVFVVVSCFVVRDSHFSPCLYCGKQGTLGTENSCCGRKTKKRKIPSLTLLFNKFSEWASGILNSSN